MIRETFELQGKQCIVHRGGDAAVLLLQPVDEHDEEGLDREIEAIAAGTDVPFLHLAFRVRDWNGELSPWEAPPVFGTEGFGHGAADTRAFIERALIPEVRARFGLSERIPVILGGYSLAAFFALHSAFETDAFTGIAAASPSVWFPGWIDFVKARRPLAPFVYLSLGDQEAKTRNAVMATVADRIRETRELLSAAADPAKEDGVPTRETVLEWNTGNHFRDADLRTAKAFLWCIRRAEAGKEEDIQWQRSTYTNGIIRRKPK